MTKSPIHIAPSKAMVRRAPGGRDHTQGGGDEGDEDVVEAEVVGVVPDAGEGGTHAAGVGHLGAVEHLRPRPNQGGNQ